MIGIKDRRKEGWMIGMKGWKEGWMIGMKDRSKDGRKERWIIGRKDVFVFLIMFALDNL